MGKEVQEEEKIKENKNQEIEYERWYYEVYYKERQALRKVIIDQSYWFDKALLTLSSGAFALSVAFLKQISSNGLAKKGFLILGWIFLMGCIIIVLISFQLSQKAHNRLIKELDKGFFKDNDDTEEDSKEKNSSKDYIEIMNFLSLVFFVVGIICLATFVMFNLKSI